MELDEPVSNENMELKLSALEILPTLPLPDIVILNEQPGPKMMLRMTFSSIQKTQEVRSCKAGLTLDSEKLDDGNLISPPLQSGVLKFF